ncbi:insulinase family protein [Chitinophaga horti]|uniref:Insulinase family protein n=1 Tax=Chitinophaga horti TaxID=2920382 RepID=A0ABY6J731_9BACT|nr:insulinase family protein [Chitinophaga horti]UYQ95443.1 insulinase family protein [Chitinophaga horti]
MSKKFLVLALIAGASFQSFAQTQKKAAPVAAATEVMPVDPAVKIGKLPNGLTYYIRKNAEPKNRAVLFMAVKAGSLMETDAQQGLAHFAEHMSFNGTKDFPKNELINYLQKAGVKFGADLNAYTGFDQTVYQLPIPTDSVALFHNGFKILANWAGYVTMDDSEIDAERGIIVEEERARGKNAQSRMQKELLPVLLKGSRYENRLPIGKLEVIQSFPKEEMRNFYKDWYRPNLQGVIAVGDFDPVEVEKLIKENFGPLKNPANPKPAVAYTLPDNPTPLYKLVTDVEFPYHVAMVMMRHKGATTKTVADARKNMVVSMINNMLTARLNEIKQKGNAPFLEAQFSSGPYQGGMIPGTDATSVVAVSKNAEEMSSALKAVMAEVERMAQFGFTAPELEVMKKNIEAGNEKGYLERDKTPSASYVQQYLKNFLTGSAITSADYRYELNKKLLSTITLAEVNAAAKALTKQQNVAIIIQAPEKDKAKMPTEAQVLATIKDAAKGLTPYVDNTVNKPLLEKQPVAGKIVSEEKLQGLDVTKLKFSNGVTVLLKPTTFRNDQIQFASFGAGGTSLADDKLVEVVGYTGNIGSDGIGDFDNTQLRKLLAGNTANVAPYISDLHQGFNGGASPKDLETALQLVYAYATNPRKDQAAFKQNMDDFRVMLTNKNVTPEAAYKDTMNAVFTSYAEREKTPEVADLQKISLDKSFEFYKDRFSDASGQTFVFVGNFDVEKIKPLLATYLGGLPSTGRNEQYIDRGIRPLPGKVEKTVRRGIEDKASVQLTFHGKFDYSVENNLQLNALSDILEFKVLERLREKESGVYTPNVGFSASKLPTPYYSISISFNCATANVDKLVAAALDEVELLKKNGATETDVEKFKAETQRAQELNLRENGYWLSYLTSKYRNGDDPLSLLTFNERLKLVTPASVKATAEKYLSGSNFVRGVLVPEK